MVDGNCNSAISGCGLLYSHKPTDQNVKNWQGPNSAKWVQTQQMEPFSIGWLITLCWSKRKGQQRKNNEMGRNKQYYCKCPLSTSSDALFQFGLILKVTPGNSLRALKWSHVSIRNVCCSVIYCVIQYNLEERPFDQFFKHSCSEGKLLYSLLVISKEGKVLLMSTLAWSGNNVSLITWNIS